MNEKNNDVMVSNDAETLDGEMPEGGENLDLACMLAQLFGGPRLEHYTPEEDALIDEAQDLVKLLRDRYNSDAAKIATLAQMAADVATRIASQKISSNDVVEGFAWITKRDEIVRKGRNNNETRAGVTYPYTGTYYPTLEMRAALQGISSTELFRGDTELLASTFRAAHEWLAHGLTGYSLAFVAEALAAYEREGAEHHARVHGEPGDLQKIKERLEWAKAYGYAEGHKGVEECEAATADEDKRERDASGNQAALA